MTNTSSLKSKIDFRQLVEETRQVSKYSKTVCPFHDDHSPSLHVYEDGFFCFVCSASGDHLDWLEKTRGLDFRGAVAVLERFSLVARPASRPVFQSVGRRPHFRSVAGDIQKEQLQQAARLKQIPVSLSNHGFTLSDCRRLTIAADGDDAVLPIRGSSGQVLALQRRFAKASPHRYSYLTKGHGAPAWCSPNILGTDTVLIVEGELNGMMCWLTQRRDGRIGVMGTAGAQASFHTEAVKDKTVYLYADDDAAGHQAILRWSRQAFEADAREVYWLEPWQQDACELAAAFGKRSLRRRLLWSEKQKLPFDAATVLGADGVAPNSPPLLAAKPLLMQSCSRLTVQPPKLSQGRHDGA